MGQPPTYQCISQVTNTMACELSVPQHKCLQSTILLFSQPFTQMTYTHVLQERLIRDFFSLTHPHHPGWDIHVRQRHKKTMNCELGLFCFSSIMELYSNKTAATMQHRATFKVHIFSYLFDSFDSPMDERTRNNLYTH